MIKNTIQENLTKEKLTELTQLRNNVTEDQEMSEIERLYTLNSFEGMISSLQEELDEYKALKKGNLKFLEAKSLEELPKLIIKARIALGMSQTDLAKMLNVQVQQIQRYEANEYQSISFDRLVEIAKLLGVCIRFENTIIIGSGPKFEVPDNISETDITNAEQKVKERCSLVI